MEIKGKELPLFENLVNNYNHWNISIDYKSKQYSQGVEFSTCHWTPSFLKISLECFFFGFYLFKYFDISFLDIFCFQTFNNVVVLFHPMQQMFFVYLIEKMQNVTQSRRRNEAFDT